MEKPACQQLLQYGETQQIIAGTDKQNRLRNIPEAVSRGICDAAAQGLRCASVQYQAGDQFQGE